MSSLLTTCQIYCLVITFTILLGGAMVLTTFSSDMLIYDEGNVYSCPLDHMKKEFADKYPASFDEGKAYQIDPISHA